MMHHRENTYLSLHARVGHGLHENRDRFNIARFHMRFWQYSVCLGKMAAERAKCHSFTNFFITSDTQEANKFVKIGILNELLEANVHVSEAAPAHASSIKSETEIDFEE